MSVWTPQIRTMNSQVACTNCACKGSNVFFLFFRLIPIRFCMSCMEFWQEFTSDVLPDSTELLLEVRDPNVAGGNRKAYMLTATAQAKFIFYHSFLPHILCFQFLGVSNGMTCCAKAFIGKLGSPLIQDNAERRRRLFRIPISSSRNLSSEEKGEIRRTVAATLFTGGQSFVQLLVMFLFCLSFIYLRAEYNFDPTSFDTIGGVKFRYLCQF